MDRLSRDLYLAQFEIRFMRAEATAFQDFFADLMEARFPGDFQRVTTWGREGDLKNDGYLASQRKIFQCYGPQLMADATTLRKIEEDYAGAAAHWSEHMDGWVFVHNQRRGLPAPLLKALADLNNRDATYVTSWGFPELMSIVTELDEDALVRIFGRVPARPDIADARFEELLPVLEALGESPPVESPNILPVSPEKLSANGLSEHVRRLLQVGMEGMDQVKKVLAEWRDPTLGDRVAHSFNQRYLEIRGGGREPDEIFAELQVHAGWEGATPPRQAAILAVLAYLFFTCDIFEAPLSA